jgi:hypothetical protein
MPRDDWYWERFNGVGTDKWYPTSWMGGDVTEQLCRKFVRGFATVYWTPRYKHWGFVMSFGANSDISFSGITPYAELDRAKRWLEWFVPLYINNKVDASGNPMYGRCEPYKEED